MYKIIGQDSDGVCQAAVLTLGEALASAAEMIESGSVNVEIECPDGRTYNESAILDMVRGLRNARRT